HLAHDGCADRQARLHGSVADEDVTNEPARLRRRVAPRVVDAFARSAQPASRIDAPHFASLGLIDCDCVVTLDATQPLSDPTMYRTSFRLRHRAALLVGAAAAFAYAGHASAASLESTALAACTEAAAADSHATRLDIVRLVAHGT